MRKTLGKSEGQRKKFQATFSRTGKKVNYQGHSEDTILLTNITDVETGKIITDHLWFAYTKGFEDAHLKEGCVIEFEARVKKYEKGYANKQLGLDLRKFDYKLSHPTKIKVVKNVGGF
jgi:mRNA-degrading endonuclease YafQ of YafQ-DinJ toxin-antitoxin module